MIAKKKSNKTLVIDLDGPNGNAFAIMGVAGDFCRQLGRAKGPLMSEMMSGNYLNLLKVFDREFGMFVTLETDNPEYLKALAGLECVDS
jgi:hypothetical protein